MKFLSPTKFKIIFTIIAFTATTIFGFLLLQFSFAHCLFANTAWGPHSIFCADVLPIFSVFVPGFLFISYFLSANTLSFYILGVILQIFILYFFACVWDARKIIAVLFSPLKRRLFFFVFLYLLYVVAYDVESDLSSHYGLANMTTIEGHTTITTINQTALHTYSLIWPASYIFGIFKYNAMINSGWGMNNLRELIFSVAVPLFILMALSYIFEKFLFKKSV